MNQVDELLTRRVDTIIPSREELEKVLHSTKKLKLYMGFDPSKPNLHIGHLVGLLQLKLFQNLGHEVIFLIGDFTAMIGDPTDKTAARTKLTRDQVLANAQTYKDQAGRILNFSGKNPVKMKFNSEWLDPLKFADIIELASNFTVQQMIERDMFQERIKQEKPIFLHELLYPLMVTYDAIAMNVDLEVGGTDQLFNMMVGRPLIKHINNKDKFVITTKLLTDSQGTKIGKTTGNAINLFGNPNNLFGQIMSLPDDTTIPALKLITTLPLTEIDALQQKLTAMDLKKRLALEIISMCHGPAAAKTAQSHFENTFQKQNPGFSTTVPLRENLAGTISSEVGSMSEAKRLIRQGAVDVSGATISDPTYKVKVGDNVKIGKKTFVKVIKP